MRSRAPGICVEPVIEKLEPRRLLDALPAGAEFRVNAFTTGRQGSADIAMDAAGNFVVVWQSLGQVGGYGIYAQRYNAAGEPLGGEVPVHTSPTWQQDARSPAVAMDPDGDFVVVWERMHNFGFYDVYARRFDATGTAHSGEFRVHSYTQNMQRQPDVAIDADGDFVVVWEGTTGEPGRNIYAQRFDAAGIPQGSDFVVNNVTGGFFNGARVAADAAGNFIVTWHGQARLFDAQGVPLGNQFSLATGVVNSLAMHPDGHFVGVWEREDIDSYDVFAQRYDAAGQPVGAELLVNTYTTHHQRGPSVAMGTDGAFVVGWTSAGQDGDGEGVYAQRFDEQGQRVGGEFLVNTYTNRGQGQPAVAMDEDGDFVLTWGSWYQDGVYGGVYAQRYELVPLVNSSSFAFQTGPQRLHFDFDENVAASLATDDILLENLTTGQTIPASALALAYDTSTHTATFSYIGSAGGFAGVLPDGNYRATLIAAGITTPNGNPLPADHVLSFFFLNGDANRDGRVNLDDFNILAQNFGQSNRDFTQADFTYDGVVNLSDFNVLAQRFGTVLPTARGSIAGPGYANDRDDQTEQFLA